MTKQRVITITLLIGLVFGLTVLTSGLAGWHLPDNQQGYAPVQPINFSHRLHAGELQINCRFCHSSADSSRYAGIPASDTCMKCHRFITAPYDEMQHEMRLAEKGNRKPNPVISPELKKLYASLALNDQLQPIEGEQPKSIPWVRVHNLPDYACFNHQAHVTAGVSCQHCHGPVESMERVEQYSSLSMGWCVQCHREANENGIKGQSVDASTNCTVCHH